MKRDIQPVSPLPSPSPLLTNGLVSAPSGFQFFFHWRRGRSLCPRHAPSRFSLSSLSLSLLPPHPHPPPPRARIVLVYVCVCACVCACVLCLKLAPIKHAHTPSIPLPLPLSLTSHTHTHTHIRQRQAPKHNLGSSASSARMLITCATTVLPSPDPFIFFCELRSVLE